MNHTARRELIEESMRYHESRVLQPLSEFEKSVQSIRSQGKEAYSQVYEAINQDDTTLMSY